MKKSISTLLIATAVFSAFSSAAHAAMSCEGLFLSADSDAIAQPAWMTEVHDTQAELALLRAELEKPESLRANKDPRWFASFRKAGKNPVTLGLIEKIQQKETDSTLAFREVAKWKEIADLETKARALQFPDSSTTIKVRMWAAHELNELRGMFAVKFTKEEELTATKAAMTKLEGEIARLSVDKDDSDRVLKTLRAMIRFDLDRLEEGVRADVERIMGRSIKPEILHELQIVARRANRPLTAILEMMRAADDLGMTRKTADGNSNTGINDRYIAILVRLAVENGRTPQQIVELFKDIDQGAIEKKDGKVVFTLEDFEVTALTQIAVEHNVAVPALMKRVFEIRDLGKTYKGTGGFSHLSDTSIVGLAHASLIPGAGTPQKLVEALFSVYDLHRAKEENRSPSDSALAVILRSVLTNGVSAETSVENYRSYFSLVQKTAQEATALRRFAIDDEIALWSELGTFLSLTPQEVVETARRLSVMVDGTVGAHTLHALLEDTFKLAVASGHKIPTDLNIQTAVNARLVQHRDPISWIRDQAVRAAEARAAEARRRASSSSGRTSSGGSSIGSSSGSSSGTSSSGFGWAIDSSGLDPVYNTGAGVGIDMKDGSLTINLGGGISLDTDGSGLKIGF